MNIDREKMLETANELLSGQVGSTPASRAINRLAGAVLVHALMAEDMPVLFGPTSCIDGEPKL